MSSEVPPDGPDSRFEFSYRVPTPSPPGAVPLTAEEAEKALLKEIQKGIETGNPVPPMWELANLYKVTGQVEKAGKLVQDLLSRVTDLEQRAYLIMSLGQIAERAKDFELAVRFYREAIGMEPCDPFKWYFIHNNLGYSLNQLGRFAEGEFYCRRAIEISPQPPNAHKNLGLALQGQEKYADAARCFVNATQANASDARATGHLEQLLAEHPELRFEFGPLLESCKQAVQIARQQVEKALKDPPSAQ